MEGAKQESEGTAGAGSCSTHSVKVRWGEKLARAPVAIAGNQPRVFYKFRSFIS